MMHMPAVRTGLKYGPWPLELALRGGLALLDFPPGDPGHDGALGGF